MSAPTDSAAAYLRGLVDSRPDGLLRTEARVLLGGVSWARLDTLAERAGLVAQYGVLRPREAIPVARPRGAFGGCPARGASTRPAPAGGRREAPQVWTAEQRAEVNRRKAAAMTQKRREAGAASRARILEVLRAEPEGLLPSELAQRVGLSRSRLWQMLREGDDIEAVGSTLQRRYRLRGG